MSKASKKNTKPKSELIVREFTDTDYRDWLAEAGEDFKRHEPTIRHWLAVRRFGMPTELTGKAMETWLSSHSGELAAWRLQVIADRQELFNAYLALAYRDWESTNAAMIARGWSPQRRFNFVKVKLSAGQDIAIRHALSANVPSCPKCGGHRDIGDLDSDSDGGSCPNCFRKETESLRDGTVFVLHIAIESKVEDSQADFRQWNDVVAILRKRWPESKDRETKKDEARRLWGYCLDWLKKRHNLTISETKLCRVKLDNFVEFLNTELIDSEGQEHTNKGKPTEHDEGIPIEFRTKPMSLAEAGTLLGKQPSQGTKEERRAAAAKACRRMMNGPNGLRHEKIGELFVFDTRQGFKK